MQDNKYLKAMQQATVHVGRQSEPVEEPVTSSQPPTKEPKRKLGRPPGKSSNPDWEPLTIFIRKDTRKAALHRLADENGRGARDFSEVIDQLVAKWAKKMYNFTLAHFHKCKSANKGVLVQTVVREAVQRSELAARKSRTVVSTAAFWLTVEEL